MNGMTFQTRNRDPFMGWELETEFELELGVMCTGKNQDLFAQTLLISMAWVFSEHTKTPSNGDFLPLKTF